MDHNKSRVSFSGFHIDALCALILYFLVKVHVLTAVRFIQPLIHFLAWSKLLSHFPENMSSNSSEYANGEISQNGGLDDRSSSGTQTPAADHHESHGVKMFGIAEIPLSGPNRVLMCQTKNELLDNKCFTNDIRTIRDIEWFLAKPNVLLDCVCTNMKMIIERMLAVCYNLVVIFFEAQVYIWFPFRTLYLMKHFTKLGRACTQPTMPPFSCQMSFRMFN